MTERHIQTPIMHRVVVHNGLVFIGGTVADDMSAGLEGQTAQILAKFDEYLKVVGTDKTRLLSATIFLTDLNRKSEMDQAWKRWLPPERFPARATVGVADLGEDTLIEIMLTAAVG
ncbi:RidA family protein [Microvirga lotononidis]|nr:RidA family protein [Microvirga lotononidis]WQO26974.1 RidA family protein [Microvirga lotononidis]